LKRIFDMGSTVRTVAREQVKQLKDPLKAANPLSQAKSLGEVGKSLLGRGREDRTGGGEPARVVSGEKDVADASAKPVDPLEKERVKALSTEREKRKRVGATGRAATILTQRPEKQTLLG
jgi:hypothetical protein